MEGWGGRGDGARAMGEMDWSEARWWWRVSMMEACGDDDGGALLRYGERAREEERASESEGGRAAATRCLSPLLNGAGDDIRPPCGGRPTHGRPLPAGLKLAKC